METIAIDIDTSPASNANSKFYFNDGLSDVIVISDDEEPTVKTSPAPKSRRRALSNEDIHRKKVRYEISLEDEEPGRSSDISPECDIFDPAVSPCSTVSLSPVRSQFDWDDDALDPSNDSISIYQPAERLSTIEDSPCDVVQYNESTVTRSMIAETQNDQPSDSQVASNDVAPARISRNKSKRQTQEERATVKQLSHINRKSTSRHARASEITLEMSPRLYCSPVADLVKEIITQHGSSVLPINEDHYQDFQFIKFQRKITCQFDEVERIFVPSTLSIEYDSRVCVIVQAKDILSALATSATLKMHVDSVRLHFPRETILYIVEGLGTAIRKLESEKNKRMRERVRQLLSQETSTEDVQANSSDKQGEPKLMSPDSLHEALVKLQFLYNFRVIHAASDKETAEWIAGFAMDIANDYYIRHQRDHASVNIDMQAQQKSAAHAEESVKLSLMAIKYVTPISARSVASTYSTMNSLVSSLVERGPSGLTDVRTPTDKAAIGATLSKAIHALFTSTDPSQPV